MTVAVKNYFTCTKMGNYKSQVSFHSFDNVNLPVEKFIQWEYLGTRKVNLDVLLFYQTEFISRSAIVLLGILDFKKNDY